MEECKSTLPRNPKGTANMISLALMNWMNGFMKLGSKRAITGDDLFPLLDQDKAEAVVNELEEKWVEERRKAATLRRRPRLWRAMLRTFSPRFVFMVIALKFLDSFSILTISVMLWSYLKILNQGSHMDDKSAILFICGISLASFLKMFSYHQHDYQALLKGMRLKVATIGIIYNRILGASRSSLSKATTGHIINLASNDAKRLEEVVFACVCCLLGLFQLIVATILLCILVGWQALSGVLVFLVLIAYTSIMSNQFGKLRAKAASVTDKRLSTMSEIISGIRAVKMFAWEWNYRDRVKALRSKEIGLIRLKSLILSTFSSIFFTSASIGLFISIVTLQYSGIPLNAFNIFTVALLLDIIRSTAFADLLRRIFDAKVALDRVEKFLLSITSDNIGKISRNARDAITSDTSRHTDDRNDVDDVESGVNNVDDVRISFLSANEARKAQTNNKGSLYQTLDLSASPKLHYSMNNDKLFGDKYVAISDMSAGWSEDDDQYVLHDISLRVSSNQLVIVTGEVGSGKTSLLMAIQGEIPIKTGSISCHGKIAYVSQVPWVFSGTIRENIIFGKTFDEEKYQRIIDTCDLQSDLKHFPKGDSSFIGQRGVSLSGGQRARVSLARAVYSDADIFLLDDPMSAIDAKVGQHIFSKCICGELSGKLKILVTHQLQFLKKADTIVILKEGRIQNENSYEELNITGLLRNGMNCSNKGERICSKREDVWVKRRSCLFSSQEELICSRDLEEEDEEKVTGSITWRVYVAYFRAGLPTVAIIAIIMFYIAVQVSLLAPSWWLSRIATMSYNEQRSGMTLGIYGTLVGSALVLTTARAFVFFTSVLRSSETLHDRMALAVIKSPVLFFDTNPVGRIMNRFSKDVGCMDDLLPLQFDWAITLCFYFVGVTVLAATINVWLLIAIIPMAVVFAFLCRYYVRTARELKRLEAIRCSPMYSHITDTITGLEIIRSSDMLENFLERFIRYQDEHTKAFFLVTSSARWLGIHLDLLCGFFIASVAVGTFVISQDPGVAGMLLTLTIDVLGLTQYGIRVCSEVENQMTSVERVITYTKLPPEPGYTRRILPPEDWPYRGALSIQDLSLTYLEGGPRVLVNVSFDVKAKEKVGIVGRTGAGKSSLIAALFRMPDPMGKVLIDGLDLGTLDIQAARKAIAVITQDPILFEGNLIKSLDPFNCFSDTEIWTALDHVQLKNTVENLSGKLQYRVGESGSGFSVGERQLLCLARALLLRCRVLVMDEATANVDFRTDHLIQKVIRQEFANCTVLTIAHRLDTIMDYDKVVVLDRGHVVEFDKPQVLSGKANGVFASLIRSREKGFKEK